MSVHKVSRTPVPTRPTSLLQGPVASSCQTLRAICPRAPEEAACSPGRNGGSPESTQCHLWGPFRATQDQRKKARPASLQTLMKEAETCVSKSSHKRQPTGPLDVSTCIHRNQVSVLLVEDTTHLTNITAFILDPTEDRAGLFCTWIWGCSGSNWKKTHPLRAAARDHRPSLGARPPRGAAHRA